MEVLFVFQLIVLLFSVIVHEVSHGYAALHLGDHTARLLGRLTLNPLKHIDPIGSILVPIVLALVPGGVVFGWAKPVPYNPNNLRNPEKGGAFIAAMGPASNLSLAIIFGLFYRFATPYLPGTEPFILSVVVINSALAVFNLIPIPPLDGSKILFGFLPRSTFALQAMLERYGFIVLLVLIFSGLNFLSPLVSFFVRILAGVGF